MPLYQYFTPPQTVVRQPLREMARLAVEHALRLSENGVSAASETVDICLRAELVERESVGRPAGADLQGRQPKLMASLT